MNPLRAHPFKTLLFFSWFLLLALLINRDFLVPELSTKESQLLQKAREETYYGVWFQKKRIGYVVEQLQARESGDYLLRQKANFNLKVLKTVQPVNMDLEAELDGEFALRNFHFTFSSPFYTMNAEGRIEGKTVHFTMNTGESVIKDTITLAQKPMAPVNQRAYLLKSLSKKGDKIKITSFDPLSLAGKESTIEYMGLDKELIRAKIHNLHHFTETYSGIKISFWLNENGKVVKEQSPAGFVFIAEPEFKARDIVDSSDDLLDSVAVHYTGTLPSEDDRNIRYRLTLPAGFQGSLQGGRQSLLNDILTIEREIYPPAAQGEHNPLCVNTELLAASRFVQADHPEIIAKAKEIVGGETDPTQQVQLLSQWLYLNLHKRSVLGLPDALTTLRTKRGDCNEHAALFAALARSLSIPTAISTGVVYYNKAFYYHAWNEVCLNGQRISLDTTLNQIPADLTHIRFGMGDSDQELQIGSLLGNLQLDILAPALEKKQQ